MAFGLTALLLSLLFIMSAFELVFYLRFRDLWPRQPYVILCFPVAAQVKAESFDNFPQQALAGYCIEKKLPFLDILPALRERKEDDLYFDYCHLTELEHEIVAGELAGFLMERVA